MNKIENTLVLTVGLPRSGKSTWATQQGCPVVNPDSVRKALHGKVYVQSAERMVWSICHYMVTALFFAGHDRIIFDACNHTYDRRIEWQSHFWKREYKIFQTDIEECCARVDSKDPNRLNLLAAIVRMHANYEPVTPDEGEIING